MRVTAAVKVLPHDVTMRADPIRKRTPRRRPRYIDVGNSALAKQETMPVIATIGVGSHDVTFRVDTIHFPRGRPRWDSSNPALAQQKPMLAKVAVKGCTDDVTMRVEPSRNRT